MFEEGSTSYKVAIGVSVFCLVAIAFMQLAALTKSYDRGILGFRGGYGVSAGPHSDLVIGNITSGASLRSVGTCRDDTGSGDCKSFLGGPEPPVFYDVGNETDQRAYWAGAVKADPTYDQLVPTEWWKGTTDPNKTGPGDVVGFRGRRGFRGQPKGLVASLQGL